MHFKKRELCLHIEIGYEEVQSSYRKTSQEAIPVMQAKGADGSSDKKGVKSGEKHINLRDVYKVK